MEEFGLNVGDPLLCHYGLRSDCRAFVLSLFFFVVCPIIKLFEARRQLDLILRRNALPCLRSELLLKDLSEIFTEEGLISAPGSPGFTLRDDCFDSIGDLLVVEAGEDFANGPRDDPLLLELWFAVSADRSSSQACSLEPVEEPLQQLKVLSPGELASEGSVDLQGCIKGGSFLLFVVAYCISTALQLRVSAEDKKLHHWHNYLLKSLQ